MNEETEKQLSKANLRSKDLNNSLTYFTTNNSRVRRRGSGGCDELGTDSVKEDREKEERD
jgi:hypothetical protein